MRIIAGTLKGRRLRAPAGQAVRPTSDRLRETLFNVLAGNVTGAQVLDAFAGTGALGIEALSRGAVAVTFVESDLRALKVLQDNVSACGVGDACAIIRGDFLGARVSGAPFDLVLLDPPYDAPSLEDVVECGARATAVTGLLVLEHSRRRGAPALAGSLVRYRTLTAGDSALSFYRAPSVS